MNPYDFAIKTAGEAGELLITKRDEGFKTATKGGDYRDLVTEVDVAVNDFIIESIKKNFPEDIIYSEEAGGEVSKDSRTWIIDAIDGTSNFSRNIPHYAICIGLLEGEEALVGAMYNPVTREMFSFEKGKGAFVNEKRVHVSDIEELKYAQTFFHAGRKEEVRDWGGESYRRLLGNARKVTNPASSALDICFIGAGRADATIYGTLTTIDIVSALGFLKEAGGVISDKDGNEPQLSKEPQKIYCANNRKVLDEVRELLEG